jgi:hypothetical protein
MRNPNKEYIGDGVYAQVDPEQITLTTEDGISVENTIVLEANLVVRFVRFAKRHGFLSKGDA